MRTEDIDWIARARSLRPSICHFVNGRTRESGSAERLRKYSPRDGALLYEFESADPKQVDDAVMSARSSLEDGRWSELSLQRRKDVLHRLASLIEAHREEFALLESLDVGKPIADAYNFDVPSAVTSLRFNAEAADKVYGKVYAVDRTSLSYELRRPVGVVAAIVGWNFPLYLAAQKIGPALVTGNSLVVKPSELTSLSVLRVAELALEAGVPEGVFNVVHGDGRVGAALAHHWDVDLLSFTGSSRTGKALLAAAGASNMKRLILECGGKTPNIVFDDCPDVDVVADSVLASAFWNQGQVCIASSRLLVQKRVRGELLAALIHKLGALKAGDPLRPETRHGALVSRSHRDKVRTYLDRAVTEGATPLYQSTVPPPLDGGFYAPFTVFDAVKPQHTIAQEEVFGPVLSVMRFEDEAEAIRIANGTMYGLAAVVWTRDAGRAHRLAQRIDVGSIACYSTATPSGGPIDAVLAIGGHKQSGWGAEGGLEGLESYLRRTTVQSFV